ncbi:MAG: CoA transferase [Rubrivivax sp.]|jgi:crotonobetainyl-CoA:carnitine CoA-transferase CaiB-like acyl-CoA transferase|nr:CoA transferase [Rubrivivax sp.]
MGILDGLTVIELSEVYQGPLAAQTLGDFGARVIKIERGPVGDPLRGGDPHARAKGLMSSYFAAANRNKESVCLDLKTAEGCEALRALLCTADVLIHNYRPGVMDKLGFGYEAVAALNPRLVYAAASGYGQTGPMAAMAGQDIVIQSFSGLAANGLVAQGKPRFVNAPLTDFNSGMLLVQGILLALLERTQSGRGQQVCISLLDAAVAMQSLEAASTLNYDFETRWFDRAPNFVMQARDGWVTVLGFFRDNPLQIICQALEIEDLSVAMDLPDADRQLAAREAIAERLAPAFARFDAAEIVARLQGKGMLAAPILGLQATLALPQVAHNGMIRSVPVDGQPDMQVIDHPLRLSRTPHTIRSGPPALGQHTAAVLASLGLDQAGGGSKQSS